MQDMTALTRVFQRYRDIQAVYLFGSIAAGQARAHSDLDLAIVPRHSRLHAERLNILAELARQGFCDVDLVFLDTSDVVLKHQAVRLNRVIYASPDFDRGGTYSRVIREYLDFLPYLKAQRAAYRARILDDQSRSNPEAPAKAG